MGLRFPWDSATAKGGERRYKRASGHIWAGRRAFQWRLRFRLPSQKETAVSEKTTAQGKSNGAGERALTQHRSPEVRGGHLFANRGAALRRSDTAPAKPPDYESPSRPMPQTAEEESDCDK